MARKWANVFVAMATAILSVAGRWIFELQKGYRRLVVLFLLGIVLFSVGMLPVRSQPSPDALNAEAQTQMQAGKDAYKEGRLDNALKHWEQAERIYAQLKNKDELIRSRTYQVQALQASGNYIRACEVLLGALVSPAPACDALELDSDKGEQTITRIQDAIRQRSEQIQPLVWLNFGDILRAIGKLEESQDFLNKGLAIAGLSPQTKGALLLNLGNTYRARGNLERDRQDKTSMVLSPNLGNNTSQSSCKEDEHQNNKNYQDSGQQDNKVFCLYQQAKLSYEKVNQSISSATWIKARLNLLKISVDNLKYLYELLNKISELSKFIEKSDNSILNKTDLDNQILTLNGKINSEKKEIENQIKFLPNLLDQKSDPHEKQRLIDYRINLSHTLIQLLIIENKLFDSKIIFNLSDMNDLLNSATVLKNIKCDHLLISNLSQNGNSSKWIKIADLLRNSIKDALCIADKKAASYASGELSYLYETIAYTLPQPHKELFLQLAQDLSQSAIFLAQTSEALYRWQWQLGRIYQAQAKLALTQDGDSKAKIDSEAQKEYLQKSLNSFRLSIKSLDSSRKNLLSINSDTQFSFRDDVEPIYREFVDLLLKNTDNFQEAIDTVDSLQLAELENFIRCKTQFTKIEENSFDDNTALIYPILLKDRLEVLVKTKTSTAQKPKFVIQRSKPESINKVNETLFLLSRKLSDRQPSEDLKKLSNEVYKWLFGKREIQETLKSRKIQTLVFVLDGAFRSIPMPSLHDGESYLIEKYAVALAPRLDLPTSRNIAQVHLKTLAFGISDDPDPKFVKLPAVETELTKILFEIPGQKFLNKDFTSQTLKDAIKFAPFPIVHLATHGQFSSNPKQTFIKAWNKEVNINEFSQMLQVRNQPNGNPIELLVLSACDTAKGDERAILGLAGIGVKSGVRSVVASLSKVDANLTLNEDPTVKIMRYFYNQLSIGKTRAEALRYAQQELMRTKGYEAPYFWAFYALIGNWF